MIRKIDVSTIALWHKVTNHVYVTYPTLKKARVNGGSGNDRWSSPSTSTVRKYAIIVHVIVSTFLCSPRNLKLFLLLNCVSSSYQSPASSLVRLHLFTAESFLFPACCHPSKLTHFRSFLNSNHHIQQKQIQQTKTSNWLQDAFPFEVESIRILKHFRMLFCQRTTSESEKHNKHL